MFKNKNVGEAQVIGGRGFDASCGGYVSYGKGSGSGN